MIWLPLDAAAATIQTLTPVISASADLWNGYRCSSVMPRYPRTKIAMAIIAAGESDVAGWTAGSISEANAPVGNNKNNSNTTTDLIICEDKRRKIVIPLIFINYRQYTPSPDEIKTANCMCSVLSSTASTTYVRDFWA